MGREGGQEGLPGIYFKVGSQKMSRVRLGEEQWKDQHPCKRAQHVRRLRGWTAKPIGNQPFGAGIRANWGLPGARGPTGAGGGVGSPNPRPAPRATGAASAEPARPARAGVARPAGGV